MRIGELAKQAQVSRDTIRFYERHGLIQSDVDPEATNGYRLYSDDTVLTLEVIRNAQSAGLSIADITVFMGKSQATPEGRFDARAFLDTKIAEVTARIEGANQFLEMLHQTKSALAATLEKRQK